MTQEQITLIRAIPIEDLASCLGLDVRHHKALCPFHNDHHASLSFNVRKNTYRCFVCDAHGDTIDLVRHLLNKDFQQACLYLSDGSTNFNSQSSTPSHPNAEGQFSIVNSQFSISIFPHTTFDPARYEKYFDRPYLSPEARRFLFDQRRLDPRVIRWCRLTSWRDRQGTDWLQIPYFDTEGRLIGIQNRNLDYNPTTTDANSHFSTPNDSQISIVNFQFSISSPPRFRFPAGSHCSIYNLPVLNRLHEGEPLYIAEGASDCWALLSAGHKAIAIPSATLLNPNDLQPLLTLNSKLLTQFHMYPDRDLPGERLFLQLQALLPNLTHHHLPPPCKDYSEYFVKVKRNGELYGKWSVDSGQWPVGREPVNYARSGQWPVNSRSTSRPGAV